MSAYEVEEPILNSPYEEPAEHWLIQEGETPQRIPGRRKAVYFCRPPAGAAQPDSEGRGAAVELALVNLIRERLAEWRTSGYAGETRTTLELLKYWRREGRQHRLFLPRSRRQKRSSF